MRLIYSRTSGPRSGCPELPLHLVTAGVDDGSIPAEASEAQTLAVGNVADYVAGVTGMTVKVGVRICWLGMDVCLEEPVLEADQDVQERQLVSGRGDGERDGWEEGVGGMVE